MAISDKTKEQLISELTELRQQISKLEQSEIERKRVEEELQKRTHELDERLKDLNCFYSISKLVEKTGISLEEILQGVVDLLPSSWQYPEITCARIVLEGKTYKTNNFEETDWKQTCNIIIHGNLVGVLEIYYLEEKPESDEGPFQKEERSLINAIAERLGRIIERKWAEKAHLKSEEKYRAHFANVSDVIYSIDLDYKILNVSPSVEIILGYTPEELIGRPYPELNLLTDNSLAKALSDNIRVLAGERNNSSVYEFIAKDGTIKIGEVSSSPLYDENKIIGVISVGRDITERKEAEEELKNTKDHLDNIIESSLDSIVVTDNNGYITRANKSFLELIGYCKEDVIGKHTTELTPTEEGTYESTTGELIKIDKEYFNYSQAMVERLNREKKITNWDVYYLRNDKKVVPVEMSVVFLRNVRGEISGAVGINRDITERKKAEVEKISIEGRLQDKVTELSIMNEISEVLLSTRELDEILHIILIGATAYQALGFNRAFLFLINQEESMLEGKVATGSLAIEEAYKIWEGLTHESHTLKELLQSRHGKLSKEDEPINNLAKKMKLPLREGKSIFTQVVYENKSFNITDGTDNPLIDKDFISYLGTDAFALVPLVSRGKTLGVLLADNFINKKPIVDEDVERLRAFANHASLAIENSHLYKSSREKVEELRRAYNELQENRDKLLRYERLSAVGNVAARVTHEIRNPLVAIGGFARRILRKNQDGEANRNYVKIIVEEIDRLENTLTDILSFAKPALPKCDTVDLNEVIKSILKILDIEITKSTIRTEKHFDPALPMLWLDENQIRRVVINLIRNAIQAMPDGGTIIISTTREGQWVKVQIADTGVGISDEDINKLFDAFFTSKSTGSGLGLTVSAQIINNHGGTIEVQKREPQGTLFIIRLPIKETSALT